MPDCYLLPSLCGITIFLHSFYLPPLALESSTRGLLLLEACAWLHMLHAPAHGVVSDEFMLVFWGLYCNSIDALLQLQYDVGV